LKSRNRLFASEKWPAWGCLGYTWFGLFKSSLMHRSTKPISLYETPGRRKRLRLQPEASREFFQFAEQLAGENLLHLMATPRTRPVAPAV
jgi:hypothetical protein